MAATYNTSQGSGVADGGSTTRDSPSVVVPSGAVCYVHAVNSDGSPADVSGVAWDPTGANQSLTQIGTTISHGTYAKASVWVGKALTAGTAVFRVTFAGTQGERAVSVWVGTGIDTTTPNGTVVQFTNTSTNTITTGAQTTVAGKLYLFFASHLTTSGTELAYDSPTPGTERQDFRTGATPSAYDGAASQDYTAVGTSTTFGWTLSGGTTAESWAAFLIPLNDSGGGGGSPVRGLIGGKLHGGGMLLRGLR